MQYYLTIITALFVTICCAQTIDNLKPNAISFELGKTGFIYNINFDHKLATKHVGFRFGAGSNFANYLNAKTIGGGVYYLIGGQGRFLELGVHAIFGSKGNK